MRTPALKINKETGGIKGFGRKISKRGNGKKTEK